MQYYITNGLRILFSIWIAVSMLACGSNPSRPQQDSAAQGQNLQQILALAEQADNQQKHPLMLQAADILLQQQRPIKALELILHIDTRYLSPTQLDSYHLYYAEALLLDQNEDRSESALQQLLAVTSTSDHSIAWQIRYAQSLSDSYAANHNYLEAARQRIALDDLIDNAEQLDQNNTKIWAAIDQVNIDFLKQSINQFNSRRVNGWLDIVLINKQWGGQPDRLFEHLSLWEKRYPLHPARQYQQEIFTKIASTKPIKANQVAVLLPLSGRFASFGKMVHDGIVAAHYQQPEANNAPILKFYDTAQSLSGLVSYQKAIADGADFVVGPLDKKAIDDILAQDSLASPILFLNSVQHSPDRHKMVFQFDLSIEDEAIQAAHRAWEKGYRKAVALVSDDKRGERATSAFRNYFEQLGGELIDVQKYSIKKSKGRKQFSADVKNLLRVNSSIERKQKLEQILGRNIEFEMRRRQDAEFIFMIAKPADARRIKPFINFYFALDLPVISTSRVYSGKPNVQLDNDLNGIEFSDIPLYVSQQPDILVARQTLKKIEPQILKNNNGRLFSLGFDAYQIIPKLTKLKAFPEYRWYGLSGEIGIDKQGFVHRYLTWAKFKNGIPQSTKERVPPEAIDAESSLLPVSSD
ncbi:MAG: penicillin-binding protein activator [Enterobacterales bacterium]|nr:penicillin-binding protein activator [Enterobacterales bacterium]